MAHAFIVIDASPEKHRQIQELVNRKMRYRFEGNMRKGWVRPTLSEVRVYDVRSKEETLPHLLRDLDVAFAETGTVPRGGTSIHDDEVRLGPMRKIQRILRIIWRLTPLKGMVRTPGDKTPEYKLRGYHYAALAGTLKDPRNERGQEIL